MKKDIKGLIKKLSLEEKATLCSGRDFWTTKAIEHLDIPSVMLTDGPHGLRKQQTSGETVGLNESVPATCFPTGAGLAVTWNRDLILEMGVALGTESLVEDVAVLLGPAVNIKRSPLCGRNFEYLSEDPYLTGELAKNLISGIQSKGIGTSIKHFAVNNQEKFRMTIDAVLNERSLREIYLPGFEIPVKDSRPWTVMCAYNKINGTYCSENSRLLTNILRDEWDFNGIVVTDWGACNDRVEGLKAGQDLEMPGNNGINDAEIAAAVKSGRLNEDILDRTVERILRMTLQAAETLSRKKQKDNKFDVDVHHQLARKVAGESMVLLRNEEDILPLEKMGTIAFIGAFAKNPRYQGGGSSRIQPTRIDTAYEETEKLLRGKAELRYAEGYSLKTDRTEPSYLEDAVKTAREADVAVLFLGLTDSFESEGYDRTHLDIPQNHKDLLAAVKVVQDNIVVVLISGAPVEMPWLHQAKAVLESYLGGQAAGGAVADILFGEVNPSGKLAETFPEKLSDTPCYLNFPGGKSRVDYSEGLFVGYRYYDSRDLKPLFPFGFGLSYTSFEYSSLRLSSHNITDKDTVYVKLTVTNTGNMPGKETVQVYVRDNESTVVRPVHELKGFEKISLAPGESKDVVITLNKRSFAFWDTETSDWKVESGEFTIQAGSSSRDIRLTATLVIQSTVPENSSYNQNTQLGDLLDHPAIGDIAEKIRKDMTDKFGRYDPGSAEYLMMDALVRELPLRNLVRMSGGKVLAPNDLDLLLAVLNREKAPSVLAGFSRPSSS